MAVELQRSPPGSKLRSHEAADFLIGLGLAAVLILLAFVSTGGFDQSITVSAADTWAEIAITLLGAAACAAVLLFGAPGRAWGAVTVALFALLLGWTALSITWSVQPDNSWQAANLTFAYLAAFAGAASLARLLPERWPALVWAIAITTVALSGYALLTKIFPSASDTLGRLQDPLGYWNAIGVIAAMGMPPCLWAWSRRGLSPFARGLAAPALAILIAVVVLSYSRSAVIVAVVAVGCWVVVVPRRLLSAALLGLGAAGAAVMVGWALSKSALTSDNEPISLRTPAGHTFGVVVLVCLVLLAAAGIAAAVASDRMTLGDGLRRRIGIALLCCVALIPVVGVIGLAQSSRGLTGEISHAVRQLTSVNAGTGDTASRLGSLGSSRPLYWSEGITVGDHAVLKGVGALGYATARTRYTTNPHVAVHAHSYVIQTYADLGLIGIALSLALLIAWGGCASRAIAFPARWASLDERAVAEREGLVALALVVIAFGLQSAIDWTWFFVSVTVPALLCAGWLAGRGPLAGPVGRAPRRPSILARPAVAASVIALGAVSLLGAWLIWQPQSSADSVGSAESAAAAGNVRAAFADARDAADSDPLALQPLFLLSALYQSVSDRPAARAELVKAVQLQPDNSASWLQLGSYDLQQHRPRLALASLQQAYQLDPTVPETGATLNQAKAALSGSG